MNANTEMVLCIDPKDKNESLKIINKVPSKVKDEHKHLEPMRFNAIKPMTPGKSEIRKLTLSSHPGKAIIKKENDSKMYLGEAKDSFKIFITNEGIMFSE